MSTWRWWRGPLMRVAGLCLWAGCQAAPAALATRSARSAEPVSAGGFTVHEVEPGDTLPSIGARYLRQPGQWRQLQRLNGIADPQSLPAGRSIRIPARLLKASAVSARVEFVRGNGAVTLPHAAQAGASARPGGPAAASAATHLAAGASLTEGARIRVPEDGYLRLRLADGSIVRVLAGSDVELKRLRRSHDATSFESVVDVKKGRVESEVSKQPKGRVFEIHAPGAVASVRGTRFDVSVAEDGRVGTAVTRGEVALRAVSPGRRAVARTARVGAGEGRVVAAGGRLGGRRVLPRAPDVSALAVIHDDADGLLLDLGDAARGIYEVRVARDPRFYEVLCNGVAEGGRLRIAALDDGHYTVGVRALDAAGLAGPESRRAIRVQAPPAPQTLGAADAGGYPMRHRAMACGLALRAERAGDPVPPTVPEAGP